MNWVALEAIATLTLVLTSAGAIGYAALQLRTEREYRAVNNLEKQLSFFLSDSFVAARRRLAETRIQGDQLQPLALDDPPIAVFEVLDFYDHLGLLVRKGHLEIFDVWHTFYEWAQPVYIDLRTLIESDESEYKDHYCELRDLMRSLDDIQLKRMHEQQANHWALWTPDRILDYYRYESEAKQGSRRRQRARRKAELKAEEQAGAVQAEPAQAATGLVDSEGLPLTAKSLQTTE